MLFHWSRLTDMSCWFGIRIYSFSLFLSPGLSFDFSYISFCCFFLLIFFLFYCSHRFVCANSHLLLCIFFLLSHQPRFNIKFLLFLRYIYFFSTVCRFGCYSTLLDIFNSKTLVHTSDTWNSMFNHFNHFSTLAKTWHAENEILKRKIPK